MTQGYITLATKSQDDAQIKQAVALASSLKLHDPAREFCLVVDSFDCVPQKYEDAFDSIVELPYGNYDPNDDIVLNIWQVYHCSPYEQTIYFDRKSIVLDSMNDIWDNVSMNDYTFNQSSNNFRGELSIDRYQFFMHDKNKLPKFYTDVFYFSKCERSAELFKMLDVVLKDFRRVYLQFVTENRPNYFDLNLLFNITFKLLGEQNNIHGHIPYTSLRLDTLILNDHDLPPDWVDYLSHWWSKGVLKVGNHRVTGIVCYNSEQFLDQEILEEFRKNVRNSKNTV